MRNSDSKALLKGLLAAGVAAAALAALPAQAATLTLVNATMNQNYTAQLTGPAFSGGGLDVYEGPLTFTVTDASHVGPYSITAFCVDIFDEIGLGDFSPNLSYETETLASDRDTDGQHLGAGLDGGELLQINRLLTVAAGLELNMGANAADLAAIQGAIWRIENPTYGVASHNGLDGLTQQYIDQSAINDPAAAGFLKTGVQTTIISTFDANGNNHQAFAFANVPEPATWGMMIVGFGGVGAVVRRRRAAPAAATA